MYVLVFCLRSSGGFSLFFRWPNQTKSIYLPTKSNKPTMEVPARREAHHLDLQGWPCLNLFNVCGDLTQNCSERVVNLVDSVEYVEKIGGHWWHRVAKASGWLRLSSTAHKPGSGQHAGFKWPQAKDAKDAEGSHFLPSLQQAVHPANARWCEQAVGYHTICSWEIILWKWQCHH